MADNNLIFTPLKNKSTMETESTTGEMKISAVIITSFLILTASSQVKKTIDSGHEDTARIAHDSNFLINTTSDVQSLSNNFNNQVHAINEDSFNTAQGVYSMTRDVDVEKLNSKKKNAAQLIKLARIVSIVGTIFGILLFFMGILVFDMGILFSFTLSLTGFILPVIVKISGVNSYVR